MPRQTDTRRYHKTLDRAQQMLLPDRVEDYVSVNNRVRAIDAYVESLDLKGMKFRHTESGTKSGQPPYDPWGLLKLFMYGYMNGICSSRKLEAECRRNLEVIWLVNGAKPSYKTIADFRKKHVKQIKEVSGDFVTLCRESGLLGGKEVAVDGTFFKADASIGSIQTEGYVDKAIELLDKRIEQYMEEVERADTEEGDEGYGMSGEEEGLSEKIEELKKRRREKEALKKDLAQSGEKQVSSVDEDARLLRKRGKTVAGYNVQIAVDGKNKLVVAEQAVQDGNDMNQLSSMAKKAKEACGVDELTVLGDSGYYNGEELKKCEEEKITAYVAVRESGGRTDDGRLGDRDFVYDADSDCYRCPGGRELTATGSSVVLNSRRYRKYRSDRKDCDACVLRSLCLRKGRRSRDVLRYENQETLDRHGERMKGAEAREKMKNRGAVVEHPFGTIKHRAGLHQFLMRGIEKCNGELSLIVLSYNFTRVLNIMGMDGFMECCARRARGNGGMEGEGLKKGAMADDYTGSERNPEKKPELGVLLGMFFGKIPWPCLSGAVSARIWA